MWIYDLAVVAAASGGTVLAFLLWRSFDRGEVLKTIWGGLGLWLLLWTVGEIIWSYDQLVGGEQLPYPSLADLAWLAGYAAVAAGLQVRYRSLRMSPGRGWRFKVFWAFSALATLLVVLVAAPIVLQAERGDLLANIVNVLYPVGDLAVTIGSLLIAVLVLGGVLSVSWSLIAAGLFCAAASDLLYVHAISIGMYQVEPADGVNLLTFVINMVYLASYLIVDAGLVLQGRIQRIL